MLVHRCVRHLLLLGVKAGVKRVRKVQSITLTPPLAVIFQMTERWTIPLAKVLGYRFKEAKDVTAILNFLGALGFLLQNSATSPGEFFRWVAGSQVHSLSPYPFQCTKY